MPRIIKTKTINSIIVEYLEYCSYKKFKVKNYKILSSNFDAFCKIS